MEEKYDIYIEYKTYYDFWSEEKKSLFDGVIKILKQQIENKALGEIGRGSGHSPADSIITCSTGAPEAVHPIIVKIIQDHENTELGKAAAYILHESQRIELYPRNDLYRLGEVDPNK